jgi:hypothetical protein
MTMRRAFITIFLATGLWEFSTVLPASRVHAAPVAQDGGGLQALDAMMTFVRNRNAKDYAVRGPMRVFACG